MSLDPRLRAAPTSALVFLICLLMLVALPTRAADGVVLPDFTRIESYLAVSRKEVEAVLGQYSVGIYLI